MSRYWILVGETPIETDVREWGKWFDSPERILRVSAVGDLRVSTVFLGIDFSFEVDPEIPLLFETMVFGPGLLGGGQWRWRSYREAVVGHDEIVQALKDGREPSV